ncbi:MAG: hypothetical protein C4527_05420 [Candidatus Omnitrophota bacterium]|jgi:subtilisin family serine protease|nr:MAG: hypothetical protein C4527_05420 [Candidatus Omnitrophota bacterium]
MVFMKKIFHVVCLIVMFSSFGWVKTDPMVKTKYVVMLDSPPVLMQWQKENGKYLFINKQNQEKLSKFIPYEKKIRDKQSDLIKSIRQIDKNVRIGRQFIHLINALTLEIDSNQIGAIRNLPGVESAALVRKCRPLLTSSHSLMNLSNGWEYVGGNSQAGKGIFIAIVDTGIDITHPSFNDSGYELPPGFPKGDFHHTNKKVIAARVFPPSEGDPGDVTPFDRDGHGTAVASAAGSEFVLSPLGFLSGVAPKAYLGNYKIFTSGEAELDQVVAAVEQAVLDGADVLNFSFGADIFADPQHDPAARAIQNAIDLGIMVVTGSGNAGRAFSVGFPGQIDDAVTVGAVSNSHVSNGWSRNDELLVSIIVDGISFADDIPALLSAGGGPFTQPLIGRFPVQDADLFDGGGYGGSADGLLCDWLNGSDIFHGWTLVQLGGCNAEDQINHAMRAGSRGVLFYPISGNASATSSAQETSIPSLVIDRTYGLLIKEAIRNHETVQIELYGKPISDRSTVPNHLSNFSSIGPSVDYGLKPDVVAVGAGSYGATQNDYLRGAWFQASGFHWFQGTSFSAPRGAGLAALMRQLHPDWPAAWIKSAIVLGAKRTVTLSNTEIAAVLQRGAGRIDAESAMRVDTLVIPPMVGFGGRMVLDDKPETRRFTVVNLTSQPCDYTLVRADNFDIPQVELSHNRFSLDSDQRIVFDVNLPVDSSLAGGDFEGDLILTNETTNANYSIPVWGRIFNIEEPVGDVILVDDDGGRVFEQYYQARLDEIGVTYMTWDVKSRKQFPTLDYLLRFKTVIWFLSETSLNSITDESSREYADAYNPRHLFEMALMKYLTRGGSLILSGQDYFDDMETSAFSQDVLRVEMAQRDQTALLVHGVDQSPVGGGFGTFSLDFPEGYDNLPDDIRPLDDAVVQAAYYVDEDMNRTVGVTIDACSYRAVFFAFPLEVLPPIAGAKILRKSMKWLQEKEVVLSSSPKITKVAPTIINIHDEDGPYSITIEGEGFVLPTGYRAYLDFFPIHPITRETCNTLTGTVPAGISAGVYNLRVVTGDGVQLWFDHALTVVNDPSTNIPRWNRY